MAEKSERQYAEHGFPPFYREDSRILILGSFPSVKSRSEMFYYAHPQNRFWRVLAGVYGDVVPAALEEKISLLERHGIALWDTVERCEIRGSSDSSISAAVPTDIGALLKKCGGIEKILLNGRTAEKNYIRYNGRIEIPAAVFPSTSPANAAFSLERLISEWRRGLSG